MALSAVGQVPAAAEEVTDPTDGEETVVPFPIELDDISAIRTFLLSDEFPADIAVPDLDHNGTVNAIDLTLAKRAYFNAVSLYDFQADIGEIYLNEEETVTFTVDARRVQGISEIPVSVFDDSGQSVAQMHDDGADGDFTAGDGIYTAQVSLMRDDICNIDYYAAAGERKSNPCRICFYRELTKDELLGFEGLMDQFREIEDYDAACAFAEESEAIADYQADEAHRTVSFESVYHMSGYWKEPSEEPDLVGNSKNAISFFYGVDYTRMREQIESLTFTPAHPNKKDVIVLCPYQSTGGGQMLSDEDYHIAGELLGKALDSSVTVRDDQEVTIDLMKHLDPYGTVIICTHGGIFDGRVVFVIGDEYQPSAEDRMKPGDIPSSVYYANHSADIISKRIIGCVNDKRIALTGDFFDYYYESGSLQDSFWYVSGCHTLENPTLAEPLRRKGVGCILGTSDVAHCFYVEKMLYQIILNRMVLCANTALEALNKMNQISGGDRHMQDSLLHPFSYTYPVFYGDLNYRLMLDAEEKKEEPETAPPDYSNLTFEDDPDFVVDNGLEFTPYKDENGDIKYRVSGRPGNVSVVIPATYQGVTVDKITERGFVKAKHLKSVVIEGTVKYMENAFISCKELEYVSVGGKTSEIGTSAFENCMSLKTVILPKHMKTISESAFSGCRSLERIKLPYGVQEIGDNAFWCCYGLSDIEIPETIRSIGHHAFGYTGFKTFELRSAYRFDQIGTLFYKCPNLTCVNFENVSATRLSGTFEDCAALEEIVFPADLQTIGAKTFYGCASLHELIIPDGVATLEEGAVRGCTGIETLILPDSVQEIGPEAAAYCSNLKKLVLPTHLYKIGSGAFAQCTQLEDIQLPVDLEVIQSAAFKGCAVKQLDLPDTLTTIESMAFSGCRRLVLDQLPPNVREIGSEAFRDCKFKFHTQALILPMSLEKLSLSAFYGTMEHYFDVLNPDLEFVEPIASDQKLFDEVVSLLQLRGYPGSTAQEFAENPDHPCTFISFTESDSLAG